MRYALIVLSICLFSSCATINHFPEVKKIRAHTQYGDLSDKEQDLVYDIMEKALESDYKEYYFQKYQHQ